MSLLQLYVGSYWVSLLGGGVHLAERSGGPSCPPLTICFQISIFYSVKFALWNMNCELLKMHIRKQSWVPSLPPLELVSNVHCGVFIASCSICALDNCPLCHHWRLRLLQVFRSTMTDFLQTKTNTEQVMTETKYSMADLLWLQLSRTMTYLLQRQPKTNDRTSMITETFYGQWETNSSSD